MADSKITDLADGGAIQSGDEFVVARSGSDKKIAGHNVPGFEFDYVEKTSNQTAGAEADYIVGNAVTYDGSTRVKIEVFVPAIDIVFASTGAVVILYDGATALGRIADHRGTGATSGAGEATAYGVRFLTPSAASHTYKVTCLKTGSAGTVILNAGSGGSASAYLPAFLRITKA